MSLLLITTSGLSVLTLAALTSAAPASAAPAVEPARRAPRHIEAPPQDYAERDRHRLPADQARGELEGSGWEAEDYYLFLPRAVLYVPNLVLEGVFYPLRKLAGVVGRYQIVPRVKKLIYNDAETSVIHPTAAYQSGYGLNFGVRAAHSDLFGDQEKLSGEVRYGGLYEQAYKLSFEGYSIGGGPLWLGLDARFEVKPGLRFFGHGTRSLGEVSSLEAAGELGPRQGALATRHLERHGSVSATVGASHGKLGSVSRLGLNLLYHHRKFEAQQRNFEEPSIEQIYDTGQLVGYDNGINVLEVAPLLVWDSRDNAVLSTRGLYIEAFGGHTLPVTEDADFWHYGVTSSIFFDLYGGSRVLALRGMLEAVHGDEADIPFSELIKIGGGERLRGYQRDRFRDKIAAVGAVEYRYPIHEFVAGEVFVDMGRVGRTYGDVFGKKARRELRYGGGGGLVFHSENTTYFKAEAAYGEGFVVFVTTDPLALFSRRHKRL